MKHVSKNPYFQSAAKPVEHPAEKLHTWFISNEETQQIEWILDAKLREVEPTLDLYDNRELIKTGLKDSAYFVKAKMIYSSGAGIKKIHSDCGKSLSYAEKVHAAFERAVISRNRKSPR